MAALPHLRGAPPTPQAAPQAAAGAARRQQVALKYSPTSLLPLPTPSPAPAREEAEVSGGGEEGSFKGGVERGGVGGMVWGGDALCVIGERERGGEGDMGGVGWGGEYWERVEVGRGGGWTLV